MNLTLEISRQSFKFEDITVIICLSFAKRVRTRWLTWNEDLRVTPVKLLLVVTCEGVHHRRHRRARTRANEVKVKHTLSAMRAANNNRALLSVLVDIKIPQSTPVRVELNDNSTPLPRFCFKFPQLFYPYILTGVGKLLTSCDCWSLLLPLTSEIIAHWLWKVSSA